METLRDKILNCLIQRAPNPLTVQTLEMLLSSFEHKEIEDELEKMFHEHVIRKIPTNSIAFYSLMSYENIPVARFIEVGGVKFPRMISGEIARSEDVNLFIERLAQRTEQVALDAQTKIDAQLKSYWGNVVTLFGTFIGVFSLIVGFLKTAPMDSGSTFYSVLILSSAQMLPLALILLVFVWFLKRQFG